MSTDETTTTGQPSATDETVDSVQLLRLFATPVIIVPCPFAETLDAALGELVSRAVDDTPQQVVGKSETFDDFDSWDHPAATALTTWVLGMATQYVEVCLGQTLQSAWNATHGLRGAAFNEREARREAPRPSIAVGRSWASVYDRADAHERHFHPNTPVAAIYYAAFPAGSRAVVVHDPRSNLDYFNPGVTFADEGIGVELPVRQGSLVMFPGWLQHSVPVHEVDQRRIAVSYNLVYRETTQA
ncbi:putative 2OG-Fe(II) oxygenase [Nocardioides sp. cx-173]|uniref:putative 2OG-Fe(II) oxygenase n=1 Tax=Nocardioides sp. cx-173 TaxID=2898796 RepID=UPI001E3D619B|nr:putative 2OG-Fe(II) oxygenase [Nocardioides sp. cx-173]MCD4525039.1 2OG-Fe(II) oxygenase family protein [Nocardioides sp. cx-173]UGB40253.1 2OG-Fe(II) oxygenase family protein [Nocardioides sp. cx-173]